LKEHFLKTGTFYAATYVNDSTKFNKNKEHFPDEKNDD